MAHIDPSYLITNKKRALNEKVYNENFTGIEVAEFFDLNVVNTDKRMSVINESPFSNMPDNLPELKHIKINNVYVLYTYDATIRNKGAPKGTAFFLNERKILDISNMIIPRNILKQAIPEALPFKSIFLAFDRQTAGNMYHVVFDCGCRVFYALETGFSKDSICLVDSCWPWGLSILEMSLGGNFCFLKPNTLYFIKELHLILNTTIGKQLSPLIKFEPKYKGLLREKVFKNCYRDNSLPEKIYVARFNDKKSKRKLNNEYNFSQVLSEYGYKIVQLEHMSPLAQLQLFYNAKYIVAPHGAALSNLVACNEGTSLAEFFVHKTKGHYKKLSELFGVNYFRLSDIVSNNTMDISAAKQKLYALGFL